MTPADPACRQAAPTPVFVDDSGRRHRLVRLVGWVVGGLTLAYLALLGVSLVGSPGLVPLSLPALGGILPGPSAPQIADATKAVHRPGELLPGDPRVISLVPDAGPAPQTSPVAAAPLGTTAPRPAGSPTSPRPSATPSAAGPTPKGNPSPAGTPGGSRSPSAHPSPHSTHASPHNVKGTPTPSPT